MTAPVHRYHPALVAQFAATLEVMNPGRAFLGVGSGESLNEAPLGMDWPSPAGQLARLEEAVEIIDAYRGAAGDAGREPGEILLHATFSWAPDDAAAMRAADPWRATLVLMNVSSADPLGAIETYGHSVLPALRDRRAAQ